MSRTALLIHCSRREAETIRARARQERRIINGYVLNLLDSFLEFDERLFHKLTSFTHLAALSRKDPRQGPRTAILVRCSTVEASRIRVAAKRRQSTISGFVMHCLRQAWLVEDRLASRRAGRSESRAI